MKTVMDFLKAVDAALKVVYWSKDDDETPVWEGCLWDTPWWVAEMKLDYENADCGQPISYRNSLGKEYGDRPGFVITVIE